MRQAITPHERLKFRVYLRKNLRAIFVKVCVDLRVKFKHLKADIRLFNLCHVLLSATIR
jgi:hypothetical protein